MKYVRVIHVAGLSSLLFACGQTNIDLDAERAALRAAADVYHEAGQTLDVETILGLSANDILILPPSAAAESGREGAQRFASAFTETPGFGISFSNVRVDVAASGDMGYTLADATIKYTGPGGKPVEDSVRDFHLWKKEGGEWKLSVDIWNSEPAASGAEGDTPDALADALSAAWPGMADSVKVVDWQGNVLQEGSSRYTCLPTPPMLTGTAPMCMDSEWMAWADAWQNRKEYAAASLGISYMLAGDEGASNIDPYAAGPTEDNEWIREGAHLMLIAPAGILDGYPTDPQNGGPYVMWKGTPYAHLMVPIGSRD
jgi:ketosteroid isomerase-like protein